MTHLEVGRDSDSNDVGRLVARFAVAGMVVLLSGWLLGRLTRQPVRRLRAGSLALAIALLALPIAALPGWIHIPLPSLVEDHRSAPGRGSSP